MINFIKSTTEIFKNNLTQFYYKQPVDSSDLVEQCMKEVREKGFFVVENFLSTSECDRCRKEVDEVFEKHHDKLWIGDKEADKRVFGIEKVSALISNKFYNDDFITQARENYYSLKDEFIVGCTMANKIIPIEGNLGSGGGWHRDSVNVKQFKSILYLSDVGPNNGPFQYLEGTQYKKTVIDGIIKHQFQHNHNRFSEKEIEKLLAEKKYPLHTFTGKAGTLLLVDTSGIHRGKPIYEKHRYALTNYYWISKKKGGKGMYDKVEEMLLTKK